MQGVVHFMVHVTMKKTVELTEPVTARENGRGEPIRTSGHCLPKAVLSKNDLVKSTIYALRSHA